MRGRREHTAGAAVSPGLPGQSILVAWQMAGPVLWHPVGGGIVSFGNGAHALSLSLFSREAVWGSQPHPAGKPRRLYRAAGGPRTVRARFEHCANLDGRRAGT